MTRTAASRKHKGFDLEKRLSAVEASVERHPAAWRGRWKCWHAGTLSSTAIEPAAAGSAATAEAALAAASAAPAWRHVRVDLGCGKGHFAVGMAQRNPDTLYVGLDVETVCVMHGAENAQTAGVPNAVFGIDEDPHLARLFAPGEVDGVYLNFPAPFPKKKKAPFRLTYANRLLEYRSVLAPGATIRLKTDSDPFMQFTLTQLELAHYQVLWQTDDFFAFCAERNWQPDPETDYERRLVAKGARILALEAAPLPGPAPKPEEIVQTTPMSLFDYLPEDLDTLDYIPLGMDGAVENMRNRHAHEARRRNKETQADEKKAEG